MFLLIVMISVGCSSRNETETEEAPRIDPYDTPELSEEAEQNGVKSLKSEIPQIELRDERKVNPKIDSLLKIVERAVTDKDIDLLLTTMDTNIISSYGGGMYGHEDFIHVWQNDFESLWSHLDKIIKLGGSLRNDSLYCIPYEGKVYEEAIKVDEHIVPYAYGISTQPDTKLYPEAHSSEEEAFEIGRTYCIVQLQDGHYGSLKNVWKVNVIGTELSGYIKINDFYVSADYSLAIEKDTTGNWKITAFAPWD